MKINRLIDEEFKIGTICSTIQEIFPELYYKCAEPFEKDGQSCWVVDCYTRNENRKVYSLVFKEIELVKIKI